MTKEEALALIDTIKGQIINPVDMLPLVYLRVTILEIPDDVWEQAKERALVTLSK